LTAVPPCHAAQLAVGLNVGVGYSLPAPVVSAVNAIMNLLKINASLPPTAGVDHQETVIRKQESAPANCAGF